MEKIKEIAKKYRELFEEKRDEKGNYYYCFKLNVITDDNKAYREISDLMSNFQMDENSIYEYKVWVRYKIKNGEYIKDETFDGFEIEEPTGEDNLHLCRKCEKKFLNGE